MSDPLLLLIAEDFTTRVAVQSMATGDTNAPTYSTETAALDVLLLQLTADQRVRQSGEYDPVPTHEATCFDDGNLKIGFRLVETYRKDEFGTWQAVVTGDKFEIIGKEKVAGAEHGLNLVRLKLSQTSPVV